MSTGTFQRSLIGVGVATALLLLVPAVAMQFTPEVNWGPGDFVIAGALLFSAGAAGVTVLRRVKAPHHRAVLLLAIVLSAALIWAALAVQIG